MNPINDKRIHVLNDIFLDRMVNTTIEPYETIGEHDEENLSVSLEQKRDDSLKVAILSFNVKANLSEFDCTLMKQFPLSNKKCSGRFTDDSLFINDLCIKNWNDLERVWDAS
ncbi:hypothetical protein [Vibrio sp. SBT000027]|uniref:hypothetical protein n=1 Tax=Vibrio sp. SBT000027 TaxID=1803384 RepID=UPI000EF50282|nr:hypothetical protein [Vibrio sp. SBT000027]RLQ16640.1 hypothetical protein AYK60_16060 [Vibrio sp. SBT000027]